MKMTEGKAYSDRLINKEYASWKKWCNVQFPYKINLSLLKLGHVLDVGCGIGRNLNNLEAHGVGVDHNPHAIAEARKRGFEAYTVEEFHEQYSQKDKFFDSLLIAHVMEHVGAEESISLLKKYLPYIKSNGKIIVITPQEKGYRTDDTHVEFIDFDKVAHIFKSLNIKLKKQYSYPFPRWMGHLFPYNEFVIVGEV